MQLHYFPDGGFVIHRATEHLVRFERVSAWYDKDGKLLDCERINGLNQSRKPNAATRGYLASLGLRYSRS